ncbi:PadR family transcriptional regulator [Rhizocola hellebori]|nr:helix-turn-helix transcriptional regulator [Rhizocola hellebori]
MASLRMTTPRRLVLQALLRDPEQERYGLDLAIEAGLEPGTIYPILVAFEGAGWLSSRNEDEGDAREQGRPSRRYYRLTGAGVTAGREALAASSKRRAARPASGELAW